MKFSDMNFQKLLNFRKKIIKLQEWSFFTAQHNQCHMVCLPAGYLWQWSQNHQPHCQVAGACSWCKNLARVSAVFRLWMLCQATVWLHEWI